MLPQIKKNISSFILSEKGSMPHQSILSIGAFLAGAAIGSIVAAKDSSAQHANGVAFTNSDSQITAMHQHHQSGSSTTSTTSGTTASHSSGYPYHNSGFQS